MIANNSKNYAESEIKFHWTTDNKALEVILPDRVLFFSVNMSVWKDKVTLSTGPMQGVSFYERKERK